MHLYRRSTLFCVLLWSLFLTVDVHASPKVPQRAWGLGIGAGIGSLFTTSGATSFEPQLGNVATGGRFTQEQDLLSVALIAPSLEFRYFLKSNPGYSFSVETNLPTGLVLLLLSESPELIAPFSLGLYWNIHGGLGRNKRHRRNSLILSLGGSCSILYAKKVESKGLISSQFPPVKETLVGVIRPSIGLGYELTTSLQEAGLWLRLRPFFEIGFTNHSPSQSSKFSGIFGYGVFLELILLIYGHREPSV